MGILFSLSFLAGWAGAFNFGGGWGRGMRVAKFNEECRLMVFLSAG